MLPVSVNRLLLVRTTTSPTSSGSIFTLLLGYEGFSTSWLCRDEKSQAYVALKVGTADSASDGHEMLDSLNRPFSRNDEPGRSMIPKVLDRFTIEGPDGRHPCFAYPLASCSIQEALDPSPPFPIDTARSLAAQIMLALHPLQGCRPRRPASRELCLTTNDLDQLTVDELYAKHPLILTKPIVRHGRTAAGPRRPASRHLLGLAREAAERLPPYTNHALLSPSLTPEAVHDKGRCLSFSSDIWALACNKWAIFGIARLSQDGWDPSGDEMTWQWVLTLGKLSSEWRDKWEARSRQFAEDGAITPDGYPMPGSPFTFDDLFADFHPEESAGMRPRCLRRRRSTRLQGHAAANAAVQARVAPDDGGAAPVRVGGQVGAA
ncbi:protein kinase domain-containing protein [Magnaporthiopsis poae ATCC 64411]|uniref:Protein kinase domain-containing protein n=1 Tax=Magnaporthiopsis poae (strain ATCC 64411 / 73-15) TaxID=644358 RepID=A0A0C4DR30_MAGP6|nr:protein kinase domain-containing protein [Magnaporthiopsis poae ATCC 64411]